MASPVASAGGHFPKNPSWRREGRSGTSVAIVAEPMHVTAGSSRTQRWSGCPSSLRVSMLPLCPCCLPARWSGRTRGENKPHRSHLFSLFSPPLCCAMEPRRAILVSTTFLFSAGGKSPEVSLRTPLLITHFPQKSLDGRTRKLYSLEARHSPPRRTKEGREQREQARTKEACSHSARTLSCRPWTQGAPAMRHVRPRCLGR